VDVARTNGTIPVGWVLALRSSAASVLATVLEYATYLFLAGVLGVHYLAASVAGSTLGLMAGFIANKYWAFSAGSGRVIDHLWRYLVVVTIGIGIGLVLLWSLVEHVGVPYYIARVFSDLVAFGAWMLPAQRHWVYAPPPGHPQNQERVLQHYDDHAGTHGDADPAGPLAWAWARWISPSESEAVLGTFELRGTGSVLDVGCGTGRYARRLSERGFRVTAVDISPGMLEVVRPYVAETLLMDLEDLDVGRRFDAVLCLSVLDFVGDVEDCMRRLAEHVAEGGRLVVLATRNNLFGAIYGLAQPVGGIRINLLSARRLDAVARSCGLSLVRSQRPAPHSLVLTWERASAG
jgi:SAM-dependent methyltransferase/putative flippase GtrA